MTEDEAKMKWCPFANSRVVRWDKSSTHVVNAVSVLVEGADPTTTCIASGCMAWRCQRFSANSDGTQVTLPLGSGYCGLAGYPS